MAQPSPAIVTCAQASQRKWKVPASVSIAQYALESAWGSRMPPGSNNPFGIKARVRQGKIIDPYVTAGTDEHNFNGQEDWHGPQPFRKFASIPLAFDYHAQLLATAPVYAPAMAALPNRDRFIDLMGAHYATAPNYAASLKNLIRQNGLGKYDVWNEA